MNKKLELESQMEAIFESNAYKNLKISDTIIENINPRLTLRPYQEKAFKLFDIVAQEKPEKKHLLFQMATGSGKTLIMAGLILYLYEKGYRHFLFFVNRNIIIQKTKENFSNANSSKYLFYQ